MSLNFNTLSSIYINTFSAINFGKFKYAQTFNLDIFFGSQSFFYQIKHAFYEKLSIFFTHTMLFKQQIGKILYGYFFIYHDIRLFYLNFSFKVILGLYDKTNLGGINIRWRVTGFTDIRSNFFLTSNEPNP